MAKGAINVQITGDYSDKDIKRAIKDLESLQSQGAPAAKSVGGLTTAFKGMALAAGAFVGLSAVKDFIGDAVNQGSALEESLSKVNVVFGDSAKEIVSWSETSATAFGQSQAQALESVGTFGNLLQAFGSTADEAQVMSRRMVELAADLASFNNTSVEDALQAIQSGLSGEAEPLKRYGAALTDVRLKAVAMEKGLYSGKGALDVHAKSVAAYELILKDTALAQGDFARTSDGFANQTRIMQAAIDDLKAKFGVGIIEGFQQGATSGQGLASSFDSMEESASDLGKTLGYLAGEALGAAGDMAQATASVIGYKEALDDSQGEAEGLGLTIERWFASIFLWATSAEVPLKKFSTTAKNTGGIAKEATGPVDEFGQQLSEADIAAQSAEDALKALKDQVNALKGAISDRQAMDDFRKSLRDLDETLKGNDRSFKGMSDSALENREVLRTAFSDAADIVQGWVESGKISADEFDAAYAKLGSKVVDNFVKQGFTRSDIRKFLKSEGLWTAEFNKVGDYASAAGVNIGKDLISGMTGALNDPNNLAALRYAGMQAAQAAEAGARSKDGADTGSPSKKWKKLGGDLMSGLAIGIKSKNDDLKADAADTMQGILDKATEIISGWDDKIKDALDANNDAKQAIKDWAASTRDTLVSAFDLSAVFEGSYDEEGNFVASKFFGGMDAAIAKFEWYNNVLRKIKESGGSDQLVAFLQQQGVDKGGVWGQSLIDDGLVDYMNQNLAKVTGVADTTAQATVPAFLLAAEQNSAALYDQVVKDYGKDGEKRKKLEALMDRLAKALNRTSTITVKTVYEAAGIDGKRAAGGPVSANKAYLVGERGPEVLVMGGQSGTIIPNGDLPTASGGYTPAGSPVGGKSYNITVQAGVGDPRAIGQQVVEVIRQFESANGRVFAAA